MKKSHTLEFDLRTSEDDNTTSTTPMFVVLSLIFIVFDLSHRSKNRGCFTMSVTNQLSK
jgi:hypothetical protein